MGAEKATRGRRGNGRRLRRQRDRVVARAVEARTDPDLDADTRTWVIERLRAETAQLDWEIRIRWTGDPGTGPSVDAQPAPGRPYELPREIFVKYFLRVTKPA